MSIRDPRRADKGFPYTRYRGLAGARTVTATQVRRFDGQRWEENAGTLPPA